MKYDLLQAFERICEGYDMATFMAYAEDDHDLIEKSLKAFEIIMDKELLSLYIDLKGHYFLVANNCGMEITQEQYEILKEFVK